MDTSRLLCLHFTFRTLSSVYLGVPAGYRLRRAWRSAARTVSGGNEVPGPIALSLSRDAGVLPPSAVFRATWTFLRPEPIALRVWIDAAHLLTREGMGGRREHGSGQVALTEIAFGSGHTRLWPDAALTAGWEVGEPLLPPVSAPEGPVRLRLLFPTPLHLRRLGALIEAPTLPDLVRAACRKVARVPGLRLPAWADEARALDVCASLRVQETCWVVHPAFVRPATPSERPIPLPGVRGHLCVDGEARELVPLFATASRLHLGAHATLGFGAMLVHVSGIPQREGGTSRPTPIQHRKLNSNPYAIPHF